MKRLRILFFICFIFCCLFFFDNKISPYSYRTKDYASVIQTYNPHLLKSFTLRLADKILVLSKEYDIDPILVMSVLAQESHFNPKVVNGDGVGLGQIETKYWGTYFDFEKQDLWDWEFNLVTTFKILQVMKDNHGKHHDWVAFYHNAYNPRRSQYHRLFNRRYSRIKSLLE